MVEHGWFLISKKRSKTLKKSKFLSAIQSTRTGQIKILNNNIFIYLLQSDLYFYL
jgi:hypothetical protein